MSRTVIGSIELTAVPVDSLPAAVDHYHVTATEAAGAVVGVDVSKDATSVSFSLDAGSWTIVIAAMAADGSQVSIGVTATPAPLLVVDKVMVNVPLSMAVSLA